MKLLVELEGEEEIESFMRWRRTESRAAKAAAERKAFDDANGRTEIHSLGWPARVMKAMRRAGVETLEQAKAMSHNDWLRVPSVGRSLSEEIAAVLAKH